MTLDAVQDAVGGSCQDSRSYSAVVVAASPGWDQSGAVAEVVEMEPVVAWVLPECLAG